MALERTERKDAIQEKAEPVRHSKRDPVRSLRLKEAQVLDSGTWRCRESRRRGLFSFCYCRIRVALGVALL